MRGSMTWLISTKRGEVRDMRVSFQAAADRPVNSERLVMPPMSDNLARRRGRKRGKSFGSRYQRRAGSPNAGCSGAVVVVRKGPAKRCHRLLTRSERMPAGIAQLSTAPTLVRCSFSDRSEAVPMMNTMSSNAIRATVRTMAALSLCLVFGLARGQVDADPPDRAARLSLIRGDVSLQPAGEEEWTTAILNRPLTTGDRLWTDQAARAEIQVGQAAVRLGSNTGFSFLNVDDDTIQMRLTAGVINVRVRALTDEQIEIDTPNLALSLLRPGNYRVEVNGDGDTTVVKVSEGEAEASGGERTEVVRAGEAATFTGTEQLATHFGALGAPDEFDDWSLERDQRSASSQAAQYVAPDVTGSEDLDANGTWSTDDEYGNVWTPTRVSVDWSPYRYGRWVWVSPWGWTWIDDAPWGYAPFHYGRWAHVRNRWCWVPGPRHVRAVYAPAVVRMGRWRRSRVVSAWAP